MSVSTVVRLQVGRLRNRGSISCLGIDFHLLHSVHNDCGTHAVFCMIVTGENFSWFKSAET
jgi:hypothetical protein